MNNRTIIKTFASDVAPNPKSNVIWMDLSADGNGSVIKSWNGTAWVKTENDILASPTFTGTVTVPATGVTFTSNGSLVKSGAHAVTLTSTGATNITLPATGTVSTLAGAETLTTKTLTAPKFADGGFIADASGAEMLAFNSTTTAVNYLEISNSPTGTNLSFTAKGDDDNISISYNTKGIGIHRFQEQSATGDTIAIAPQTGGVGSFIGTITSSDLTGNVTWTLPASTGTIAMTASPIFTGTTTMALASYADNAAAFAAIGAGKLYQITGTGAVMCSYTV